MNTNKSLANEEIKEAVGEYNFKLIVEEDFELFNILKNPFIIALKCTLKNSNNDVLGVGRSNSVLSPRNKLLKNAVLYSWGASVIDACSKGVKTLNNLPKKETVQKEEIEEDLEKRDSQVYFTESDNLKYASQKQKDFISKLLKSKGNEINRKEYEQKLQSPYLSSFECSKLISNLLAK